MNSKLRCLMSILLLAAGGLFLTMFLTGMSGQEGKSAALQTRNANHIDGTFTFSTPQELTGHPPSPLFFQQNGEPEIVVDIFGNIYVTAIQGVPGGTDFWKSINKGASFVYMGQPDGAQDHCMPPDPQTAALPQTALDPHTAAWPSTRGQVGKSSRRPSPDSRSRTRGPGSSSVRSSAARSRPRSTVRAASSCRRTCATRWAASGPI